jgi:membrane associated rhomboid family serine protease
MAETLDNPLEQILQYCARSAPSPWYPSAYAKEAAIERDSLDPFLERLRLAGLIRLTDWVKGTGQGYALTPAGTDLLANPRALALLRNGKLRLDAIPPEPPPLDDATTKSFARGDAVRDVFMVQTPARVTLALIFANLLVFFYGMQLAKQVGVPIGEYLGTENPLGGQKLTAKLAGVYGSEGALRAQDLVKGEWWRLVTSFFVHLGIIHLAVNLFSLYMVGPLTERMWGSVRYFVLYMLAGFGGSCSMACFTSGPYTGAGASGAIWGLMTSVIAWLILNREHMPRPFVNTMLRRLFNLVLLNVFISFAPGISMAAHFGGGAAGVVVSVLLHGNRHGKRMVKVLSTIGLIAFPIACFAGVVFVQRSDPNWEAADYDLRQVPKMVAVEREAEQLFESKLKPILERQLQGLTEEDLKAAVQAEKEIVGIYAKGLEIAKSASGYRDPRIQNARQRNEQTFERKINGIEVLTWQRIISPAVRDELRFSGRLLRQKIQPLLALPDAARQKESLEEAQDAAQEQVTKLASLRGLLEEMTPARSDPGLEETRKEALDELALYYDLLQSAATGLKAGSSWSEEQRKHYEQLAAKLKANAT